MRSWLTNNKKLLLGSALLVCVVTPQLVQAFSGVELGILILQFFARITGIAGVLLNVAVMETVFQMGVHLSKDIGASVERSWSVVRDIANLLFIFSLIYIGFLVILDASSSHARKLLPPLIIAALLINFSLFFSKAIIDITNVAAVEIYTTVGFAPESSFSGSGNGGSDSKAVEGRHINIGVSGAFMQIMGLKALISPDVTNPKSQEAYQKMLDESCVANANDQVAANCTVTAMVFFLTAVIFLLIAAYAFAAGAFMLVWRFITLIILMILSPVMFAGMIFPKAAKFQSQWWSTFLNAAFYAPAYFMMLYIAYSVAARAGVMDDGDNFFNAAGGQFGSMDVIFNFVIVIGFLLASVWVGKQMSYHGSQTTMNVVDNLRRRGQRALAAGTVGAAAWGLRNTAGRQADKLANSERLKNTMSSNSKLARWGGKWAAERVIKNARGVADSSFDARQLMSKKTQAEIGSGSKKGYTSIKKDRDKERDKFAESLGTHSDEYVKETLDKDEKYKEERKAAVDKINNASTETEKKAAEKALVKLERDAKNKIKYARQLGYRDFKDMQDKWNGRIADGASIALGAGGLVLSGLGAGSLAYKAGGAVGGVAGSLLGSTGAAVGSAAGSAAGVTAFVGANAAIAYQSLLNWNRGTSGNGDEDNKYAGSLHKKYGDFGEKAESAAAKKKDLKVIVDSLKESGELGGGDKKDDDDKE